MKCSHGTASCNFRVCLCLLCEDICAHGTHVCVEVEILSRIPFYFLETEFLTVKELREQVKMARQ